MGLKDFTDNELALAIGAGDEPSLAEAYRRHSGAVFALARRIVRNSDLAGDVVQEVFLRLWRHPEKFDPQRGTLRSYLLSHTHGRSVDLIRSEDSRRMREEREARLTAESGLSLEEEVWEMSLAESVREAVAQLEDNERKAIELAYFGGFTYREVARILSTPEGTIKSRIRSGLKRLNVSLEAAGLAPIG